MVSAIGCGGGGAQSAGGSPIPSPTAHSHAVGLLQPAFPRRPAALDFGSQVLNTPTTQTTKDYQHRKCCCRNHAGHDCWLWIFHRYHHSDQSESGAKRECSGCVQSGSGRNSEWQPGSDEQRRNRALRSSCGYRTCCRLLIQWISPGIASTSATLQGYNVYRSTVSGGPYSKISPTLATSTLLFTDTTPVSGKQYFYVVTAVDTSGAKVRLPHRSP